MIRRPRPNQHPKKATAVPLPIAGACGRGPSVKVDHRLEIHHSLMMILGQNIDSWQLYSIK